MADTALDAHDEKGVHPDGRSSSAPVVGISVLGAERRTGVRFPIDQEVRYKVFERRAVGTGSGRTVNISSRGVLFTTDRYLPPGQRVELSVNWPAQLDHKHPLKLVAAGRVVRASNRAAAIVIDRYEFRTQGAHGLNSH